MHRPLHWHKSKSISRLLAVLSGDYVASNWHPDASLVPIQSRRLSRQADIRPSSFFHTSPTRSKMALNASFDLALAFRSRSLPSSLTKAKKIHVFKWSLQLISFSLVSLDYDIHRTRRIINNVLYIYMYASFAPRLLPRYGATVQSVITTIRSESQYNFQKRFKII